MIFFLTIVIILVICFMLASLTFCINFFRKSGNHPLKDINDYIRSKLPSFWKNELEDVDNTIIEIEEQCLELAKNVRKITRDTEKEIRKEMVSDMQDINKDITDTTTGMTTSVNSFITKIQNDSLTTKTNLDNMLTYIENGQQTSFDEIDKLMQDNYNQLNSTLSDEITNLLSIEKAAQDEMMKQLNDDSKDLEKVLEKTLKEVEKEIIKFL